MGVITQDRGNQGRLGRKHTYNSRVIIDATYEGDLATFARVPFRIDREARSREELQAYAWYNISAANKDGNALVWKEEVAKKMTKEQIALAQDLSREMIKANPKLMGE